MELFDLITYSPHYEGLVVKAEVVTGVVMAAIAAASAISSGITRAVQAKRQRKALRAERKRLDKRMADLGAFYNEDLNKDFLDTEEASSAVGKLSESYKKGLNQLNQGAVKQGMTDEAKVAAADSMNQNLAQGISSIAGQATAYKQHLKDQYMSGKQKLEGQEESLLQARAAADNQKYNDIATNIGNTGGALMTAYSGMKSAPDTSVQSGNANTGMSNKDVLSSADFSSSDLESYLKQYGR